MKKGGHLMLYDAPPEGILTSKYIHNINGGFEEIEVPISLSSRKSGKSGKSGKSVRIIQNMFEITFNPHAFKHLDTFDEWEKNTPDEVNKPFNILYDTLDISNTSQVENLNSYFSSLIIKILVNLKLTFDNFNGYKTNKIHNNYFIIKDGVKIIFNNFRSYTQAQSSGFKTRTHSFNLISILKVNANNDPVYSRQLNHEKTIRGDGQIYPSSYLSAAAFTHHTSPASASSPPASSPPASALYEELFPPLGKGLGLSKRNGGKLRSNIKKTRKKSRKTKTHKKPRKTKTHKKSRKRI